MIASSIATVENLVTGICKCCSVHIAVNGFTKAASPASIFRFIVVISKWSMCAYFAIS